MFPPPPKGRGFHTEDFDENAVWRAYIPALVHQGAASWGYTQKEALKNLQDAVDLLVECLLEEGEELPSEPYPQIQVSDVPLIVVNT